MSGHHRDAVLRRDGRGARAPLGARSCARTGSTWRRPSAARTAPALIDRLLLDEDRVADMAAGGPRRRGAARPDRRRWTWAARLPERPRPGAPARAAGRGRGGLRGAPERDGRRRQPLHQERQRGDPARQPAGDALQPDPGRGADRRPDRGRGARAGRSRCSAPTATSCAGWCRWSGAVDLVIPRGGEELKAFLHGARPGAGHLRRLGQQPRLRRRRRRPRHGGEDRGQRQGAAPGRLQRGRDAPRAPRRRAGRACPWPPRACARRAWSCAWTAPASTCSATPPRGWPRPPRPTTPPSSSA